MSRTYEALKKAESETDRVLNPPLADPPPRVRWELAASERIEYQRIRVWLTNERRNGDRPQTIMVVGCRRGAGTTTTATLLGSALAEGKTFRVLVVDANFRSPTLNTVLEVRNRTGFREVLAERLPFEPHVQSTSRENLFVLTSGQIASSSAEVLEGQAIDDLIGELKQKFDFIVFDAPPLLDFPDAYALAPKVDRIILVAEAEHTSVEDIERTRRTLEQAGGRILGAVMNRQKNYTPAFLSRLFQRVS